MSRRLTQERKSWDIYRKWQGEHIAEIRPGQEIRSFDEFQAIYNDLSVNRNLRVIKNEVRYQMSGKTYKALRKRFKEAFPKKPVPYKAETPGFADFARSSSTQELAEYLRDDIDTFRAKMKNLYPEMSSKELALEVSRYFFGS